MSAVVTPAENAWKIRAVQLDLARQKETLPAIEEFVAFARDWGYNTLVLYLEGAIKTPSFPYRDENRSYSPEEIRRIVACAHEARMQVVPVVGSISHAEHFLEHPPLQHLAEPLPAGPSRTNFNVCDERVYEFLEAYLGELVELFPDGHFHIGCDEGWDVGRGEQTARRLERGETICDLYIEHIRRMHAMLEKRGRRTWIWEDMFENAEEEQIARLPRDVVMCAWNYSSDRLDLDGLPGHFNNLRRRDWLAIYRRLGMDVLLCPRSTNADNAMNLTRHGRNREVLGGLQTTWELSKVFLPGEMPCVALTGLLWSRPDLSVEDGLDETLRTLLPRADEAQQRALRLLLTDPGVHRGMGAAEQARRYLLGPVRTMEKLDFRADRLAEGHIAGLCGGDGTLGDRIGEELHARLQDQILSADLRTLISCLADPRDEPAENEYLRCLAADCKERLEALAALRHRQWQRERPGIEPDITSKRFKEVRDFLAPWLRLAERGERVPAALNLELFVPDCYSAPRLKIRLETDDGWQEIHDDLVKPHNLDMLHFTVQVPLEDDRPPRRVRLDVSGYGGVGVTYLRWVAASRTLDPAGVSAADGEIRDAHAVLVDNSLAAYIGSPETAHTFESRSEGVSSSLTVDLG